MHLTIIKPDGAVYIDEVARYVDLSTLSPDIHAIQWSDEAQKGWIEYVQNPFGTSKPNEDIYSREPYQPYIDAWYAAAPATVSASFAPAPIYVGQETTLTWSAQNADYVWLSTEGSTKFPTSGSKVFAPTQVGNLSVQVTAFSKNGDAYVNATVTVVSTASELPTA